MPTVAALLELQGLEAKNEQLRTQAQENLAKAKLYGEQADLMTEDAALQRQTREAMKAAQEAADAARGEVTPESTAAVAQADNPVQKAIRDAMQTIKEQRTMAAEIRRTGGDSKAAEKAEQLAATADQTLRHNLNLAFDQQKEAAKRVGAAAGSVLPDGSNLPQVKAALEAVAPGMWAKAGLDEDVYGNPAWTPRTQKYLATLQAQATTAEKQLELRQKELDRQQRADAAAAREKLEKRKLDIRDQEVLIKQAGQTLRENKADAVADKPPKEKEAKAVVQAEVKPTATAFQTDPEIKLPPAQAEQAAWFYHRKVNELIAKGETPDNAREIARGEVISKIDTKTVEEGGFFKSKKEINQFNEWKQQATNEFAKLAEPEMRSLAAVGVGSKAENGVLTLHAMPGKTPPGKASLIEEANAALAKAPDKRDAILKRLKELMVK